MPPNASMDDLAAAYGPLLEAVAFAARAHQGHRRKDGQTPYVSHVFRVCLVLRHVFGVADERTLQAAVLHDTVEDTTTDYDDVREKFGPEVAGWVAQLSKDKRLEEGPREEAYKDALSRSPWQVRVCKLADIFDNLLDCASMPVEKQVRSLRRSEEYLGALKVNLPDEARRPWEIVSRLLTERRGSSAAARG